LATLSLTMKIAFASFLFAGCLLSAFAAPEFKLEGHQLVLPSPIVFKADTAELDETASRPALDHIRQYLAAKAYISKLRIEAHTDSGGDAAAGQQLTEQRALAVARWLKAQGTDCQRLLAVGFGGTKPVADNSTPGGKAGNRRVSVFNAELRGRAIGGLPTDGGGRVAGNPCD
jgi:OOP family OmpA-OmpF porin